MQVDDPPNDRMLPPNKSYDWTDDGGIIRPVNLLVTAHAFIESVEISAVPNLASSSAGPRQTNPPHATTQTQKANVCATIRRDGSPDEVMHLWPIDFALEADREQLVDLGLATLQNAALWHFDTPHLFQATVEMGGPSGVHEVIEQFGIRKFEVRGPAFYLNGEKVSLIGVERMAEATPNWALLKRQTGSTAITRHEKSLNCVFTRVHWPQDRRVLDFSDRHGILMQEEVPAWGPETFSKTSDDVQRRWNRTASINFER